MFRPDGSLLPHHQCPMADVLVIGAAKIARDITEHKRNEAQIINLAREAEH